MSVIKKGLLLLDFNVTHKTHLLRRAEEAGVLHPTRLSRAEVEAALRSAAGHDETRHLTTACWLEIHEGVVACAAWLHKDGDLCWWRRDVRVNFRHLRETSSGSSRDLLVGSVLFHIVEMILRCCHRTSGFPLLRYSAICRMRQQSEEKGRKWRVFVDTLERIGVVSDHQSMAFYNQCDVYAGLLADVARGADGCVDNSLPIEVLHPTGVVYPGRINVHTASEMSSLRLAILSAGDPGMQARGVWWIELLGDLPNLCIARFVPGTERLEVQSRALEVQAKQHAFRDQISGRLSPPVDFYHPTVWPRMALQPLCAWIARLVGFGPIVPYLREEMLNRIIQKYPAPAIVKRVLRPFHVEHKVSRLPYEKTASASKAAGLMPFLGFYGDMTFLPHEQAFIVTGRFVLPAEDVDKGLELQLGVADSWWDDGEGEQDDDDDDGRMQVVRRMDLSTGDLFGWWDREHDLGVKWYFHALRPEPSVRLLEMQVIIPHLQARPEPPAFAIWTVPAVKHAVVSIEYGYGTQSGDAHEHRTVIKKPVQPDCLPLLVGKSVHGVGYAVK